jgi:Na+-transporting NADH:ubiquinone oxidoreductase subunit NqrC
MRKLFFLSTIITVGLVSGLFAMNEPTLEQLKHQSQRLDEEKKLLQAYRGQETEQKIRAIKETYAMEIKGTLSEYLTETEQRFMKGLIALCRDKKSLEQQDSDDKINSMVDEARTQMHQKITSALEIFDDAAPADVSEMGDVFWENPCAIQ